MTRNLLKFGAPALFACACIAGCATRTPTTQEVKIPVYTSCVKAVPAKPDFEGPKVAPDASNGEKVLAIARDTPRHFKYEGELEAVIEGCR